MRKHWIVADSVSIRSHCPKQRGFVDFSCCGIYARGHLTLVWAMARERVKEKGIGESADACGVEAARGEAGTGKPEGGVPDPALSLNCDAICQAESRTICKLLKVWQGWRDSKPRPSD